MGFADKLQGKTLGKYRIDGLIGDGGQAVVYKAWHVDFESWVALKFLQEHVAQKSALRERFKREARLQFKLQHPHIVRVIEIIEEGELMGMAMDWVEGCDLEHYLENKGTPLNADELARLFLPVLGAVGYAHKQQVIHRDLKPSNILLGGPVGQEIPKVMDFGIAKSLEDESQHTKTNSVLGTPHYIAPEQATSSKYVDHRVDIYALGISLYQMLTGHLPFEGRDLLQVLGAHLMIPPPAFAEWGVHTSPGLEAVVQRSLAKDPDLRFQTCEEFAVALIEQLQMYAIHQGLATPLPHSAVFAAQGALSPAPLSLASAPLSFSSTPLSSPNAAAWNTPAPSTASLPTGQFAFIQAVAAGGPRTPPSSVHQNPTIFPSEGRKRSSAPLLLLLLLVLFAGSGGLYLAELLPFRSPASSSSGTAPQTPHPQHSPPANQLSPHPALAVKNAALSATPPQDRSFDHSITTQTPSARSTRSSATTPRSRSSSASPDPSARARAKRSSLRKVRPARSRRAPPHPPQRLSLPISPRTIPQLPNDAPAKRPALLALSPTPSPSPRPIFASCQDCIQQQVQPHIQRHNFYEKTCNADILQLSAKQCASVCQKDPAQFCFQYGRHNANLHFRYNPPASLFVVWPWWNQNRWKIQACRKILRFEYVHFFPIPLYQTRDWKSCIRHFDQGTKSAFQAWRQTKLPKFPRSPQDISRGWDDFRRRVQRHKQRIEDALPFKD
ncbi:protein kinase [Myxococcota bacterium]|nr:protein kinase [Myxococcota bacterium]